MCCRPRQALSHYGGSIIRNSLAIIMAFVVGVLSARSFLRLPLPISACLIRVLFSLRTAPSLWLLVLSLAHFLFLLGLSKLFFLSRRILPFVCLTVGFVAGFARYRESIRQGPLVVSRSVLWRGLPGTVNLTFGSQPSSSLDFAHSMALWLGYTWCRHSRHRTLHGPMVGYTCCRLWLSFRDWHSR